MAKIPKAAIKRLVTNGSGAVISDDAAEAIAAMLEGKAKEIAEFAVLRAKKNNRKVVVKEDIEAYSIGR